MNGTDTMKMASMNSSLMLQQKPERATSIILSRFNLLRKMRRKMAIWTSEERIENQNHDAACTVVFLCPEGGSKMKKALKILTIVILILACLAAFAGCRQSRMVAYNISKEADAFNVQRRITVINARTDTIMLELTGTFSLKNNDSSELEIICELEDGTYQKHFIYLNEFTLYVVEDISNTGVSKYYYELNILPYMTPVVVPDFTD